MHEHPIILFPKVLWLLLSHIRTNLSYNKGNWKTLKTSHRNIDKSRKTSKNNAQKQQEKHLKVTLKLCGSRSRKTPETSHRNYESSRKTCDNPIKPVGKPLKHHIGTGSRKSIETSHKNKVENPLKHHIGAESRKSTETYIETMQKIHRNITQKLGVENPLKLHKETGRRKFIETSHTELWLWLHNSAEPWHILSSAQEGNTAGFYTGCLMIEQFVWCLFTCLMYVYMMSPEFTWYLMFTLDLII